LCGGFYLFCRQQDMADQPDAAAAAAAAAKLGHYARLQQIEEVRFYAGVPRP
jgi:hypothetical protein